MFANANAVLAAAKDTGFGDVEIELDPLNAVFLQGVHLADLRARDFDHAPTGANFSLNGPLLENAPVDTVVGTVTGVDPDLGDTFQFALTNNANGAFRIDAATGVIRVNDPTKLDFERTPTLTIAVQVTDQFGLSLPAPRTFTINLTNAAEPVITPKANSPTEDTTIVIANVTDPLNGTLTLTATGPNLHGTLSLNSGTGDITYRPAQDFSGVAEFDYTVSNGQPGGIATAHAKLDVVPVGDAVLLAGQIVTAHANGRGQFQLGAVSNEFLPSLAKLADGRFVATFNDTSRRDDAGFGDAIRGRIFNADGTPSTSEFLVNTTVGGDNSRVSSLANGGFVVTWIGRDGSGNGNGIKAQVFNASGTRVGGEFTVNTQVLGDQDHRAIASLGNGFVVTWDDPNGDGTGNTSVKARIFTIDAQGNAVAAGGEILVNTATAGTQKTPSVTALSDGRFVVAWEDNNVADIKAQIFNANGQPATGELPINSTTTGGQGSPTITALGTGFVAVWVDFSGQGGDSSSPSIKARIFNASGVGQGNEFLVNTVTQGTQNQPVVTVLGNGDFVVCWTDLSDLLGDVDGGAIKAQVFDPTGKKIGGEFLVNTITAKNQQDPAITALGNNSFAVTWTDNNGGVQGQVFTLLNTAQDTALPLSIAARTTDTDGSEHLASVVVSGIPAGTKLTDGTNTFIAPANNATVNITAWNFSNITVTPPSGFSGALQLVVTATTTDTATLSDGLHTVTGQAVQTVDITVTPTNTVLGTAGADTLIGRVGSNNLYLVNNTGDVVVANQGFDTVQSTLSSYTLGANVRISPLLAPATSPAAATSLTT